MHIFSADEREFLDEARVARLATLGQTGKSEQLRPHCIPVCFAVVENHLWIPLDEKPKSGRKLRRIRNIEDFPQVTFLADRYEDDWSRLAFLMVEGSASLQPLSPRVLEELRERYHQYRDMDLSGGIAIVPERGVFWRAE